MTFWTRTMCPPPVALASDTDSKKNCTYNTLILTDRIWTEYFISSIKWTVSQTFWLIYRGYESVIQINCPEKNYFQILLLELSFYILSSIINL